MRFSKTLLAAALAAGITSCSGANSSSPDLPAVQAQTPASPTQNASRVSNAASASSTINITVYGNVTKTFSGGFTMKTTTTCPGGGQLNVYTSSSTQRTGPAPAVGDQAHVGGVGSCASVRAVSLTIIAGSTTPSNGMAHVMTMDYLGGGNGTHSVPWSTAAKYLTWAETTVSDASAIAAAGIKTMAYVDPNRTTAGTGDPLYTSNEATFAHTCSNARITATYSGSVKEYLMAPGSSAMQSLFGSYVQSLRRRAHFDAVFDDEAGVLSEDVYTPFSAMPCGYTDASWIAQEIALQQASPIPVFFNGLDALNGHAVSLAIGLLGGGNTFGGNYEECYASNTIPKESGWLWQDVENTELQVNARGKLFGCMVANQSAANAQTDQRLYAYASFLLSYNPSYSIYRVEYATGSGLHVMPESRLVPLKPAVAAPSSVASLLQPGGTYARKFAACYLGGTLVSACAVVVNPDPSSAHPFPLSGYHHTLVVSGGGVLDGGTVSAAGPAPPSSLAPLEARIVFI